MKKTNFTILVALLAIGSFMNVSCTQDFDVENVEEQTPMHHLGLYSFSKDLLEIYDVKVEAVCDGQVLSTVDLKDTPAYSENAQTKSYNIDMYTTAETVEYKLKLSCCKSDRDLELNRNYELALNAQFISVSQSPESAFEMLEESSKYMSQSLDGMTLQRCFGAGSEFVGQSVYKVYAIVNSKDIVLESRKSK